VVYDTTSTLAWIYGPAYDHLGLEGQAGHSLVLGPPPPEDSVLSTSFAPGLGGMLGNAEGLRPCARPVMAQLRVTKSG
jgi:hypothetical protein